MNLDNMRFLFIITITVVLIGQSEAAGLCDSDNNCTAENTACLSGICQCKQGYTVQNGQCQQVYGRVCLDDLDCNDGRTLCINSHCLCQTDEWREENGVCVSYIGATCDTWSDCGNFEGYDCADNKCVCATGYTQTNETSCEIVLGSTCKTYSNDSDCPFEGMYCSRLYRWSDDGRCKCKPGFTEKDNVCLKVLGSSCDDVACGNPLVWSYRYLSGEYEYYYYSGDYYSRYHLHLSCDTDNVCSCDHGFVVNGSSCVRAIGRSCSEDLDCGVHPGYSCDYTASICICSENFIEKVVDWYYDEDQNNMDYQYYYYWWYDGYNYNQATLCLPVIGSSCMFVSCSVANSSCNANYTCECQDGFTLSKTGDCQMVLGMSCSQDSLCQLVEGGKCGSDKTCVCKEGYHQDVAACTQVLGSSCTAIEDCPLDNSMCDNGVCRCSAGVTEFEGRCLRAECAEHVPQLPDLHRRFVTLTSARDEPVIDDALLPEGWYSIGHHSLYVSDTAPTAGQCSTYHPIYLTDDLSVSQTTGLETGEVTVAAVIGGLDEYEQTDSLNIRIRKCGKDTQIHVQPPSWHFSAICLHSESMTDVARSGDLHATVVPDLLFETSQDGNGTKYTPYVVFTCLPTMVNIKNTYIRYPYTEIFDDNDIYFYFVHWYIDDQHYKSRGPVSRRQYVTETSLTEMTLLDDGYTLGFKIRCSIDITDSPSSDKMFRVTSDEFVTGLQNPTLTVDANQGYFHQTLHIPDTPLGCQSYEGDEAKFCDLEWQVVSEGNDLTCNAGQTGEQTCTFKLQGLTHYGYANTWGSWSYKWDRVYNYNSTYNGTHYLYTDEYFGTYINTTESSTLKHFKVKFASSGGTTGHRLWEGYAIPDIDGYLSDSTMQQSICNISLADAPVISVDEWSQSIVVIDVVGDYILYRSKKKPVEIHVQTEECRSPWSGDICLCGVTYRDGDAIYALNYCNGLARIGQVYGAKRHRDIAKASLINGITIDVTTSKGQIVALSLSANHSSGTLSEGEGLCTFTPGSFKLRNGAEMSVNDGFLSSWKIPVEESLFHQDNHKIIAWTDEYMLCFCPFDAKENEAVYTNSWSDGISEGKNVFLGYFECSSQSVCSANHSGEEWTGSLTPVFSLDNVAARMEIRHSGVWPRLYLFCDFDKQEGFRYKIVWKIEGVVVKESDVMLSGAVDDYYITNDDFETSYYVLEAGFSCGVSVYDESSAQLLDPLYSDEIHAIEFVDTEILLRRGQDITVQLRLNVPLMCKLGSTCYFDFKLFDADESNDCSDSTIAFKNKHTCGQRVQGVSSESEITNQPSIVNITVTTKNNDKYTLRDTFTLKMRLSSTGDTSGFWMHTFSKSLTVFVRDDDVYWQGNYCYVNNDPRVRTFDGQYYSLFELGEFVMMRHKVLPVEVQMETDYYGWYSCGVSIRAGRDVYVINHCHDDHITGYLLADDMILKVKKRSEHRYEIYLPHGTRIDVRVSSWWKYMVNVFIYPSPSDMNQVEGLCGNFDGNRQGDLIHSDGSVTWATYYYWWWWWWYESTDSFIRSWWVGDAYSGSQSLTDIEAIEEQLRSWYTDDVFCVCMGNNGDGEAVCSANERDTCKKPVDAPGLDVAIKVRQKRSGVILDKEYNRRFRKIREKRAAQKDIVRRSISIRSAENDTVNATVNANVESCREALSSSCGVISVQQDGLNVTFEELVNNCGQDKEVDPDTDWVALTCEAMEANVEQEVQRDVEFQANNPKVTSDILTNLCVGNCTGNGLCVNGSCTCFPGFTASDCSIDLSRKIDIEGITGDGVCDTQQYDCSCIRLTTSGSVENSEYNLVHRQYDRTGGWKDAGTERGTVVYDNFNEVFVCPEISSRRKRSTTTTMADQYRISLSNDGRSFSNDSKVFVLDSRCLQVEDENGTDVINLSPGYCLIGGICYADNSTSTVDTCQVCNESASVFDWSQSFAESCQASDSETEEESDTVSIVAGVLGTVAGLAVIAAIVAFFFIKKQHLKRVHTNTNPDGTLYDMQKFQGLQLRKDAWFEKEDK